MLKKIHSIFSVQKRLVAFVMLLALIFLALFSRLFYIQIFKSNYLQSLAENQWTRDLPINAERGVIYDRNGVTLAVSYTTYDIYVRHSNVEDAEEVANYLATKLELNFETVLNKVNNAKVSESLIKMQVEQSLALEIKNQKIKGIYFSENTKRYYPYGDFLTQVLGYTTVDNVGQSGLELYFDKYLKGIDGYTMVQSDNSGHELYNKLDSYVPSISGSNLTLTIDYQIQLMAENALQKLVSVEKPKSATIIVMDPNTDEILALTSKPSFSLNDIPRDDLTSLMQNSKNLAIVDVFEPGSTFKILTTAAALEENVTSLEDRFYDPGYRYVDGQKINCWKTHGHGSQNLVEGLCNSCNSVFVDLALRLGKEKFYSYFEKYGFGNLTNVDFAGESAGIIMPISDAKNVDLARMGFGQAIAVTSLQMISAVSCVTNGGVLMQPYFVSKISNESSGFVKEFSPTAVRRVVSEDTSNKINYMLEQVIKKANGFNAFIPGYNVGGKTGTSQKYVGNTIAQGKFVSSFIGTFPSINPDYVVYVVVDEPSSGNYYGSIVATPYAKMIFEGIINYKNYQPNSNLQEDLKLVENNISMPSLVGKSLSVAAGILKNLGLQYELDGEGGVVTAQYPAPTTMVCKNYITLLCT